MNFLITGSAGFLGSSLANFLVREGHQVRGLDDLSTGDPASLHDEIHFTRGDINDRPKLWTLLQDVDVVYHLAARVSVAESLLYPSHYNDVNVGGTVSLLEAARDVGVERIVLISSGTIYGPQAEQPLSETVAPFPDSPYAVSKLSAEYYVRTTGRLWGIDTICLRVFNAYGPGQNIPPSNAPVVPGFIRQAINGGTLIIHGDGNQTRDFVFVDDVVNAMVAAATVPRADHPVINIGSGVETSIRDIAQKILHLTKSDTEVLYTPRNNPGMQRMVADISRAKELLGYSPRVMLEEGLAHTIHKDKRFQKK
ncbi:MAG: NAD-dependent epimerase/dehydratase family protein [Anaerolineales bacterium]|nr:NAD-dependent epimerase/dehydratase family protein [Anaerolineales bacterium]